MKPLIVAVPFITRIHKHHCCQADEEVRLERERLVVEDKRELVQESMMREVCALCVLCIKRCRCTVCAHYVCSCVVCAPVLCVLMCYVC